MCPSLIHKLLQSTKSILHTLSSISRIYSRPNVPSGNFRRQSRSRVLELMIGLSLQTQKLLGIEDPRGGLPRDMVGDACCYAASKTQENSWFTWLVLAFRRCIQYITSVHRWMKNLRSKIWKCAPTKRNREINRAFQNHFYSQKMRAFLSWYLHAFHGRSCRVLFESDLLRLRPLSCAHCTHGLHEFAYSWILMRTVCRNLHPVNFACNISKCLLQNNTLIPGDGCHGYNAWRNLLHNQWRTIIILHIFD